MTPPTGRSLEVDFFRGIVLLIIAVDHISGSVLSNFTLHKYAFCDSAEVFVFLGGYASAAAYTALESHRSETAARRRFFRRSWEIYRAYLFTAALMLLSGGAADAAAHRFSDARLYRMAHVSRPATRTARRSRDTAPSAVSVGGIADVCAFCARGAAHRAARRAQAGGRAVRQSRHLALRGAPRAHAAFRVRRGLVVQSVRVAVDVHGGRSRAHPAGQRRVSRERHRALADARRDRRACWSSRSSSFSSKSRRRPAT